MKPNDTSAIIPKFSDLFPNAPDQMEGETKEDFLKRVNKYVKDCNLENKKLTYDNILDEFIHFVPNATEEQKKIFLIGWWGNLEGFFKLFDLEVEGIGDSDLKIEIIIFTPTDLWKSEKFANMIMFFCPVGHKLTLTFNRDKLTRRILSKTFFPKVKYANPLDFTCSQADALRTIQTIFIHAEKDLHTIELNMRDAINLAKCFIELENVIKEVREKVKAK